ncbi:MAG: hypothetical protein A2W23_04890 [Planctomycetes bacterium RBG_16_43_13]|nr:MAG: hypothetical protein A2W23_04890 [Planctomycetes bacterium RBG_16_43_13]
MQICNNYIDGIATYLSSVGIDLQVKRGSLVSGNIIKNISENMVAIYVSCAAGAGNGQKAIISNNILYNIQGSGILCDINNSNTEGKYFVVTGNHLELIGQIGIASFGKSIIANNIIIDCGSWNDAPGDQFALSFSGSETVIIGNYIEDTRTPSQTYYGIMSWAIMPTGGTGRIIDRCNISHNFIKNTISSSIRLLASDVANSIYENFIISDNICNGGIFLPPWNSAYPSGIRKSMVTYNICTALDGVTQGIADMTVKIPNSSFITNTTFDSTTTGWAASDGTIASVAGGQGGNCLQLTRVAANAQYASVPITNLVAGRIYYYSAFVKSGSSGDEAFVIGIGYPGAGTNVYASVSGTSSVSWVNHSGTFIQSSLAGANSVFFLEKNSVTAGTMLFDTVVFYDVY